jgi:hypothetical protein
MTRVMRMDALVPGFAAESPREHALTGDPLLRAGLAWGRPRPGHPEGAVGEHVAALLRAIDEGGDFRADLRFLALVHDAFKYRVRLDVPYSPDNDHAVLARRFAERYTSDARLLTALELHDEPYWIWKTGGAHEDLHALLGRIPDVGLFLRFVELDASTQGKDPGLLAWVQAATGASRRHQPGRLVA